MGKFLLFGIMTLLGAESALARASQAPLHVGYNCTSDKRISFQSGGDALKPTWTQDLRWEVSSPENLNLVVGDHSVIIWVRQPYGTNERFLTLIKRVPRVGLVPDKEEIAMGVVGEEFTRELTLNIKDSYAGEAQVVCRINIR